MLPIDGLSPAIERSLGRIARAFARRYPECELVEEIDSQVSFPLPLGQVAPVELSGPFCHALLLSVLPHEAGQTSDAIVRAAASGAFARALELCDSLDVRSVAAPLLKAGWRVTTAAAMSSMLKVLASAQLRHPLAVEIRILDEPGAVAQMAELARSFGLDL